MSSFRFTSEGEGCRIKWVMTGSMIIWPLWLSADHLGNCRCGWQTWGLATGYARYTALQICTAVYSKAGDAWTSGSVGIVTFVETGRLHCRTMVRYRAHLVTWCSVLSIIEVTGQAKHPRYQWHRIWFFVWKESPVLTVPNRGLSL